MANKLIKSIKYPGLPDTYTFVQIGTEAGQAADAKVVGDKINWINTRLQTVENISLPVVSVYPDFELGNYGSEGYAEQSNRLRSEIIPAGTYTLALPPTGYQCFVYGYVSDTQGELILSPQATDKKFTTTYDFIVIVRHNTSSQIFTDEEISILNRDISLTTENSNVAFATKEEFEALANEVDGVKTKYKSLANISANDVVEKGFYTISSTVTDLPTTERVNLYVTQSSANGEWLQQLLFSVITENYIYFRHGRNQSGVHTNAGTDLSVSWGAWCRIETSENAGQTIVCLGDSIFGLERGSTSIPSYLALMSGATVYNCCMGGTRAGGRLEGTASANKWKWVDFGSIADSIVEDDYTNQINAESLSGQDFPSYFSTVFSTLASIDFSTVDILIINYGGNDYTAGNLIGNLTTPYDSTTFLGGLATGITKIMAAYPNLRVLLTTPPYKYFMSGGEFVDDGDTKTYNAENQTLADFATSMKELHEVFHSPIVDLYNDLGINKFNRNIWFITGDGSHPSKEGRLMTAKLVYKYLSAM